jgi:hypothetical protein
VFYTSSALQENAVEVRDSEKERRSAAEAAAGWLIGSLLCAATITVSALAVSTVFAAAGATALQNLGAVAGIRLAHGTAGNAARWGEENGYEAVCGVARSIGTTVSNQVNKADQRRMQKERYCLEKLAAQNESEADPIDNIPMSLAEFFGSSVEDHENSVEDHEKSDSICESVIFDIKGKIINAKRVAGFFEKDCVDVDYVTMAVAI